MKFKRTLSMITAAMFLFSFSMGSKTAFGNTSSTNLYNSGIGNGVTYIQRALSDAGKKQLLNIVTCDLNNKGANIIFSKAKDISKKEEVLTKQVQREIFKGNNVVAGINADMFDMKVGFSSGPQIRDGAIITNHNAKSEENIYPVFGIDKDKKAFITYIHMDAKLTLMDNLNSGSTNTTTPGAISSDNTIVIDSINRENCKDRLVLNDSQLNESGKFDYSPYAANGAVTVVKGINEPIKLGKEYEGIVESVGFGSKSAVIPKDGILLCSNGKKAQWIKSNLKPGSRIKIKVNYDKDNIAEAVGAYTYFLRNGRVLTNDEMIKAGAKAGIVSSREARTAIGITADNRVIAVTVDGGTPSKGISDGLTLLEMANYLKSLGAVDAVGMDGGGSTQMNVKLYGEKNINVITKPSDGRERALTNGVMFTSNNERSYEVGNISINKDITIFKNMTYKFSANGMDTNYNSLDLSNASLNWSVDAKIGKIDSSGVFTAGNTSGSGKVTASLGKASDYANIKVLDNVAALSLSENKIVPLQPGTSRQFALHAKDSTGNSIIINNSAAKWSVTGGIGQVDGNGLLKVTAKSGNGVVSAVVGNKKASASVAIMQNSQIIDDFEHNDGKRYVVNGYIGGVGSISKDYAKSGIYSYKISYDYDKAWDRKSNGTINLVPTYIDKNGSNISAYYTGTLKPKKLGMWVYGDGHGLWMRAEITDGDLNKRAIDLTKKIDWVGWKYVDVDIPADAPDPVTLDSIYFVETNKNLHNKGNIYIDDIKFIYSDGEDVKGPAFSDFSPAKTIYTKNTTLGVTLKDISGIEKKSIWAKLDGKSIVPVFNGSNGRLTYDAKDLTNGTHTFEVKAMDGAGNSSNPPFLGKFTVSGEIDSKAPTISRLIPSNKSVVKTQTPRISLILKDDKSGINSNDINILLDGLKLKPYYDEATGWLCAIPTKPLTAGVHTLSVTAKDRTGNKVSMQPRSFNVQPIKQPMDPNNFTISVLSDSHATEFGYEFFNAALNDNSELVLQNGDMVDSDSSSQWTEGLKQLAIIKNKPVMLSPGNHEASSGNENNFIKYFGMPTYSFEFGNSLLISLDSSIKQSISASDPTQFDYLENVLASNKKQNVFIYTHVPTKDTTGAGRAMVSSDAQKLEGILSGYKKQNPDKNINVIFGHMHSFQSWNIGGVNYTIDGNECLKKYVDPNNGGFMGYTKFIVNGSSVYHKFVPMAQSIAVVDNSIVAGEMKVIKGTQKKLNLSGDFKLSSADYISQINNIKDVDVKWESDNPSVTSVSEDGVISANGIGSANIKASVQDKIYTFKIVTLEQKDSYIGGFKVMSDSTTVLPGQSIKLNGMGYDIYGTSFKMDNNLINWQASKGGVTGGIYTAPKEITAGETIQVTAQYEGYSSTISIKVSKTKGN